jgi:hypothetical protein
MTFRTRDVKFRRLKKTKAKILKIKLTAHEIMDISEVFE